MMGCNRNSYIGSCAPKVISHYWEGHMVDVIRFYDSLINPNVQSGIYLYKKLSFYFSEESEIDKCFLT